jgi:hypothetical protein
LDRVGDDASELRDLIIARSALSAQTSRLEARGLSHAIEARPEDANILVGKFVDQRRGRNDYFDIDAPEGGSASG